jgi:phosphatidylglycerol---prolipoprotein diacylglyceryl transferase
MIIKISINPFAFGDISWWVILYSLGGAFIISWAWLQVKRGRLPSYRAVIIAAFVMVPFGFLFARFFHVLDKWEYYVRFPERIIGVDGLYINGAILGAACGLLLYCRMARLNFGICADVMTPGIIVGQAVGRVGCLITGCCHGINTNLPWGIVYTNYASAAEVGVIYHPWQLYEILVLIMILGVVIALKQKARTEGLLFALYLAIYSIWRFAGGFLRPSQPFLGGLQQAQVVALAVLAVTLPFLWRKAVGQKALY